MSIESRLSALEADKSASLSPNELPIKQDISDSDFVYIHNTSTGKVERVSKSVFNANVNNNGIESYYISPEPTPQTENFFIDVIVADNINNRSEQIPQSSKLIYIYTLFQYGGQSFRKIWVLDNSNRAYGQGTPPIGAGNLIEFNTQALQQNSVVDLGDIGALVGNETYEEHLRDYINAQDPSIGLINSGTIRADFGGDVREFNFSNVTGDYGLNVNQTDVSDFQLYGESNNEEDAGSVITNTSQLTNDGENGASRFVEESELGTIASEDSEQFIKQQERDIPNGIATLDGGGKLKTDQIPDLAITDVVTPTETTIEAFVANNANYTYQQGDVIVIDDGSGDVTHNMYKGGDKSIVTSYSEINATEFAISQINGLQGELDDRISYGEKGILDNENLVIPKLPVEQQTVDLDTIVTEGWYPKLINSDSANNPQGIQGYLLVGGFGSSSSQIFYPYRKDQGNICYRTKLSGSWSDWGTLPYQEDIQASLDKADNAIQYGDKNTDINSGAIVPRFSSSSDNFVSNGDLNNITEAGWYFISGGANRPNPLSTLYYLQVIAYSVNICQVAYPYGHSVENAQDIYVRTRFQNAWQPWRKIAYQDEVAPIEHNHEISQINGLQGELDDRVKKTGQTSQNVAGTLSADKHKTNGGDGTNLIDDNGDLVPKSTFLTNSDKTSFNLLLGNVGDIITNKAELAAKFTFTENDITSFTIINNDVYALVTKTKYSDASPFFEGTDITKLVETDGFFYRVDSDFLSGCSLLEYVNLKIEIFSPRTNSGFFNCGNIKAENIILNEMTVCEGTNNFYFCGSNVDVVGQSEFHFPKMKYLSGVRNFRSVKASLNFPNLKTVDGSPFNLFNGEEIITPKLEVLGDTPQTIGIFSGSSNINKVVLNKTLATANNGTPHASITELVTDNNAEIVYTDINKISELTQDYISPDVLGLSQLGSYANDTDASNGGVEIGDAYFDSTTGYLKRRIS